METGDIGTGDGEGEERVACSEEGEGGNSVTREIREFTLGKGRLEDIDDSRERKNKAQPNFEIRGFGTGGEEPEEEGILIG